LHELQRKKGEKALSSPFVKEPAPYRDTGEMERDFVLYNQIISLKERG
jgi:hypothetical protein